ncbi:hypothetical protein OE88DRAFT_1730373 [Heliocybe sulcata]|uniref:Small nuclear ribonucleoprotein Prp3 C-terminal domain-containing protein n=1 Tax=Heliocybe sulcata TaxID=5364 RepID=A0A5C3NHS8_9AGAM|nr:hypothetical protein OE88DRAFT_1730373 [Heliocybe sulcata]
MDAHTDTLAHQLEELNLIKCSLLPDEVFLFVLDADRWQSLLDGYPDSQNLRGWPGALSPARFEVRVEDAKLWFEMDVPRAYPEGVGEGKNVPVVSVKCEDVGREEQERWQRVVEERWKEVMDSEDAQYPLHVLLCLYLLPELHAAHDSGIMSRAIAHPASEARNPSSLSTSRASPIYHALFSSHHLISPQKRRSLQQWTSSLSLSGFAKLGYPGVIYAEGQRENLEEFIANVKGMQWLALRLRFVEPLPEGGRGERRWVEFEKVGEVVQEMKRLGREEYVLEMGIGSVGAGVAK